MSRDAPRNLMEPAIRQVRANGQSRQCSLFSQAESLALSGSIRARNAQSQIPIEQPLPGLPSFRQQGDYNPYSEGWALYAEGQGKKIGFYQDPYSDYGRLSSELLRAVRLVLDTAVHYKRWTRQQMIDFFHEHTSEDEPEVQNETDRSIVVPAQSIGLQAWPTRFAEATSPGSGRIGQPLRCPRVSR